MKRLALLIISLGLFAGCASQKNSNTVNSDTNSVSATANTSDQNPDPIKPILDHSAKAMQMHFFDNADSVWMDGDWNQNGTSGPRYISTYYGLTTTPNRPVIVELDLNSTAEKNYIDFVCPRDIGHLTITSIEPNGKVAHFTSTTGVTGSLNIENKDWVFSEK